RRGDDHRGRGLPRDHDLAATGRYGRDPDRGRRRQLSIGKASIMKANKFFLAARHAHPSEAPIETMAEDTSEGQQMRTAAVQLPFKAELPSLTGATAWLNSAPLSAA